MALVRMMGIFFANRIWKEIALYIVYSIRVRYQALGGWFWVYCGEDFIIPQKDELLASPRNRNRLAGK